MKKSGMNKKISSIFDGAGIDKGSSSNNDFEANQVSSDEQIFIDSVSSKKNPFVDSTLKKDAAKASGYRRKDKQKGAWRQRCMILFALLLFGCFCFVQYHLFFRSASASADMEQQKVALSLEPIWIEVAEIDWSVPDEIPADLQDPMIEKIRQSSTDGDEKVFVKGIVYSEKKPAAIINDVIVYEGQTINGEIKVIDIKRDSVTLEKDSRQWQQNVGR